MDEAIPETPSPEFLAELLERSRRRGYNSIYESVMDFVFELHRESGVELKADQMEPY